MVEFNQLQNAEIQNGGTLAQLTNAEVDMQVATAKRFPRSLQQFRHEVLSIATIDEETARACTYTIPRAGKHIVGPSIRFMEMVASAWGNLREEKRSLDPEEDIIRGQATVWDMERNRLVRVEVKKRIKDSKGRRYNDDMIVVTGNAAASTAHRNALRAVIPEGFWFQIWQQVQEVGAGGKKTLSEKRHLWLNQWKQRGISAERVCASLGVPGIEDIGVAELATMQGLYTAIKEGDITIDEAFPEPEETPIKPVPGQHVFRNRNGIKQKEIREQVPGDVSRGQESNAIYGEKFKTNKDKDREHAKQVHPVHEKTLAQSPPASGEKYLDDQAKRAREQLAPYLDGIPKTGEDASEVDEIIRKIKVAKNIGELITFESGETREPVLMAISERCAELEEKKQVDIEPDDDRPWEKYIDKK